MKESVIDIDDLKEMSPFFRTTFGKWIGKIAIKLSGVGRVNRVHRNSCHLRGAAFTSALLKDPEIDLQYKLHHAERLDNLPEGAFITVSNHPIGSLDGIMLIDIIASRRPDFKVMVNGVLTKVGAMKDNFISVQPDTKHQGGNLANMGGVRLCMKQIQEGHPMGFFPAGAMSFYNKEKKGVYDLPWDPQCNPAYPQIQCGGLSYLFWFPKLQILLLVGKRGLEVAHLQDYSGSVQQTWPHRRCLCRQTDSCR
ncbi:MAG: hemolysin [Phocaeicola vulgatus]|nr:MAG: hemolysin [Phocaeicola vulgatus]